MKRLLILAALILWAAAFKGGNLNAQEGLMAGNVLGLHVMEYELAQGVTDDELITFMKEKYMPGYEEHYTGSWMIPLRGDRGELKGRFASVLFFETVDVRDKYSPEKDTPSELGMAAMKKMKPIEDELARLVKSWSTTYTDWVVMASSSKTQGFPVAGNVMGFHVYPPDQLADDAAEEEIVNSSREKWIPEFERQLPGVRLTSLRGIRGEYEGHTGFIWMAESIAVRDKYWPEDGTYGEEIRAVAENMEYAIKEMTREADALTYTDWLVE